MNTNLITRARPATANELIPGCECLYRQRTWAEPKRGVIIEAAELLADGTPEWGVRVEGARFESYGGFLWQFSIEEPVTEEVAA